MHFNHGITITCHNKANITSHDDAHLKLIVRVGRLVLVKDSLLDDLGGLGNLVLDTRGSGGLLGHTVSLDTLGGLLLGDSDLVAAVVANKLSKGLDGTGTAVLNGLGLAVGGVELDGREALNLIGNVVKSSIDLGDGDLVGEGLVHLTELLVLGSKRLAVTAPGSVELDQDILVGVHDNFVVILGDNNGDGTVVLLGDGLGLDAGVDLAGDKVVKELGNLLCGEVSALEGELLVLLSVLDGESGPLADLEVEVASVLTKGLCVDGGEVDLALVLLGDRLEGSSESLTLLGSLGEDVGEGNTGLWNKCQLCILQPHFQSNLQPCR